MLIDEKERHAFYEASLRALRFVDARAPSKRRFGPEADAMWKNFKGHLTAADRVDILLRDADIETGGAFGARVAFGMKGVAEDDAFGAEWTPLVPRVADELYRQISTAPVASSVGAALAECARAWLLELRLRPVATPKAADKLLIAGPSEVASVAAAFEGQDALSFADQVTVIATEPMHRHIAVLAAALLRCRRAPRILDWEGALALQVSRGAFVEIHCDVFDADPRDRQALIDRSTHN